MLGLSVLDLFLWKVLPILGCGDKQTEKGYSFEIIATGALKMSLFGGCSDEQRYWCCSQMLNLTYDCVQSSSL